MPFRRTGEAKVQLHSFLTSTLATLTGRSTQGNNRLNMRLEGPETVWTCLEKRKITYRYRDSNPGTPTPYKNAILAMLLRLFTIRV